MARLSGFASFVIITIVVLAGLRAVHLAVPAVFPETRPGPIALARLDDARRILGFRPMIPAYHPAVLGAAPTSVTARFSPAPAITAIWDRGGSYLAVTTWQSARRPGTPALAAPLADLANAWHWFDGSHVHALLLRDGGWIEIETNLGEQELRRFADTLSRY